MTREEIRKKVTDIDFAVSESGDIIFEGGESVAADTFFEAVGRGGRDVARESLTEIIVNASRLLQRLL